MSRRDDDHIGHVPKITPARDEIASYQRTKAKGKLVNSLGEVPEVNQASAAGSAVLSKSVLAFVVVVVLATAGLAGYLYQHLKLAERTIENYELRIADLERRLEVTDESMSESSVAMKVKVRELDSEIRKLWDNVWKKSKQRMAEQDATLNKHEQQIIEAQSFVTNAKQQFVKNDQIVANLSSQLKKAEQMQSTVAGNSQLISQQVASLEAAVDKLNGLSASINKLDKRVTGNEEWVESINGFRRQVNRDITSLKQSLGQAATASQ